MNVIELMTDSSTVHRWISYGLSSRTRLKIKAASEMLIRRRIGIVLSLVEECGLNLKILLVKSADNKSDALTRIPQHWSGSSKTSVHACALTVGSSVEQIIAKVHHNAGHPGLRLQTSADVVEQLETVFYECGAPVELLTDNDTAFRSKTFAQLAARWDVRMRFSREEGLIDRRAVYLYNITPRDDRTSQATPANGVYKYAVRIRQLDVSSKETSQENSPYIAGDAVWVKPAGVRCDRRYQTGTVTGVISSQAVEVDGLPLHIRDLRPLALAVDSTSALENSQDDEIILTFPTRSETTETPSGQINDPPEQEPRRSAKMRKPRTFACCDCTSRGSVPNNKSDIR
ncbi:hypothetical protein TTRE_0000806101 [Trichuris trichiura]|uniref:Integrase catalytic domain-containing protein n=1 Tax=Trichuris trichiura TaxID=36087 RepID=A0A077ZHE0_TRITR|nr:hypothetical protein TTRE_0000806101 [Trichuris trichiura]